MCWSDESVKWDTKWPARDAKAITLSCGNIYLAGIDLRLRRWKNNECEMFPRHAIVEDTEIDRHQDELQTQHCAHLYHPRALCLYVRYSPSPPDVYPSHTISPPTMSDPYPLFSVFSFLGFIAVIVPLPWHLEAWNSGTCFFMAWTALGCLNAFINSVVWHGNALNHAPIWCDISIRILMGASVGIPAASFCINRRLYNISHMQVVSVSRAEKMRDILIDSAFCILLPIITLSLTYVVQGHRFDIIEDIGCYPAVYNSLSTFFLAYMWPVLLGLGSFIYAALTLWAFNKRRAQLSEFLTSNNSLTASRYIRLMALATTEMLCTTPLAIFVIYLNATTEPVEPWRGFADAHFAFSRVEQIPAVIWQMNHELVISLEFSRWSNPLCAFVFFAFFGFASEARKHYRLAFLAIAARVGYRPSAKVISGFRSRAADGMAVASHGSFPIYVTPPSAMSKHAESLTAFETGKISSKLSDSSPAPPSPCSSVSSSSFLEPPPRSHGHTHTVVSLPHFHSFILS
ncbi:hypothetical protein EVG20_g6899 [Dentipellis fragilis]|uniref:Uncharacterized protein n=1 Tax=Dentipellis fragilis TaxID=205917 RepID=A0A4Y9YJR3_9AGAM|nr:hypothetical protein EVG20_g6899 [Dentipellis fragilis]